MPLTRSRRARWLAALAVLVVVRSAVFVFSAGSQFDSDQAVTGLMAKHLSELRAFPVFWYGQIYMLGVEAWLAAPAMAVFGATVTALKLPLLAINVAIAWLLFGSLTDEGGLEPARAAFATLFFALAAPMTAAHYVTANGGNVEPCLYVLLLWRLWRPGAEGRRAKAAPVWFGLVLGIGFLNREFTIYGAAALLLLEAVRGTLWRREAFRRWGLAFATAAGVWVAVLVLRHYSSAAGPGTSTADLASTLAANNVQQVLERICLNPRAIASGVRQLVTAHWPEIFGLEPQPLTDFGIESTIRQGFPGAAWLLVIVLGLPLLRLPVLRRTAALGPPAFSDADVRAPDLGPRTSDVGPRSSGVGPRTSDVGPRSSGVGPRSSGVGPRSSDVGPRMSDVGPRMSDLGPRTSDLDVCAYLVTVALLSVLGYLVGRCGLIDFFTMRYELLSPLGAAGLAAAYLRAERSRPLAAIWTTAAAAVFALSLGAHARLIHEYATHPPTPLKADLIRALEARGVRYAYADYWTAYYVTFMTRERIVVASDAIVKVRTHNRLVDAHRAEAIRIARRPCPGGTQLTPAFWACGP